MADIKKANCLLFYGDDPVSMSLRKEQAVASYFHGKAPDPVTFGEAAPLEAYRAALEGQSLFQRETAVIIQNPSFLKKNMSAKAEAQGEAFFHLLEQLPKETLVIFLVDGKVDRRTKAGARLFKICTAEEVSLLKPKEAAGILARMIYEAGKRVDPGARAYLEEVLPAWDTISRPLLQTECDKIILMAGDAPCVTKELLESSLPTYMGQGIFHFTDCLLNRDARAVLDGAGKVFGSVEDEIKNIGFLSSRFRKIKMYKELTGLHRPRSEIQDVTGVKNQWAFTFLERDAAKMTEQEAEDFLLALFDYQYRKRMGDREASITEVLLKFCLSGKRRPAVPS